MPVDASPYKIHQQPNLLNQVMELGRAADTLGNISVGEGLQKAIQSDGTIDRNMLAQHLKGSVVGSMKAPEALSAVERLRAAGYATDEQGLRTLAAQQGFIGSLMGPLATKPGVTQKEMIDATSKFIANAEKMGFSNPVMQGMKTLTETSGMTDQQRAEFARNVLLQSQQAQRVLEATLPRTQTFDDNGNIRQEDVGPQVSPRTFTMERQLPPGQPTVDTRQFIPDPKDPSKTIRNPNFGAPGVTGPGGSGGPNIRDTGRAGPVRQLTEGAQVLSREPPTNPRTGQPVAETSFDRIRDGTAARRAAAQRQEAAEAPAQRAPVQTGLAPGTAGTMEASAQAYAKDLADSRTYQDRVTPLREAIPRLAKLGKTGTGPGTETINEIKSFVRARGIPVPNDEAVKTFAEAKKYLMQNATAVAPPGTNIPSVTAAFEANPNVQQPNDAALYLAKSLLTLSRLKQASIRAFAGTGLPANQYSEWASDWVSRQDPKAYGADLWSKADRDKLRKQYKEGSPRAKRFRDSLDEARGLGLLGDVEYVEPK